MSSGSSETGQKRSFDHLVGRGKQQWRHVQAKRFYTLRLIISLKRVGCSIGRSAGFAPFKICNPPLSWPSQEDQLRTTSPNRKAHIQQWVGIFSGKCRTQRVNALVIATLALI
jgi:hypothetical protein